MIGPSAGELNVAGIVTSVADTARCAPRRVSSFSSSDDIVSAKLIGLATIAADAA
jgi:hypothetical protein